MATRKGATKTVSGKRFRYNGTKWVQITGKGNATTTSSSNRASRSKNASNTPTTDSGRANRGGSRVTSDTTRTSTGSAKVTTKPNALPPGRKGGALAIQQRSRRRNVTNTPSRSGTQQASRTNSSRPARPQLRAASTPSGTSKPTDGRRTPTRMETAKARAAQAAQGSRGSTTRTGAMSSKTRRGGPLSGLVEQGLTRLLSPAARGIGYQTGRAVRKALGGGEPTLDSKGNKITKPVYKGTGLKGPDGKPLPVPSDAFKKHIASKVPQSKDKPEKDTKVTPSSDKTPTKTPPKADNSPQRKAPTRKPKTGADDPRNKEYIAARSKLNDKSSKADRDKVRDLGMAVHNKKFGKTPKKKKKNNSALAIGGYA